MKYITYYCVYNIKQNNLSFWCFLYTVASFTFYVISYNYCFIIIRSWINHDIMIFNTHHIRFFIILANYFNKELSNLSCTFLTVLLHWDILLYFCNCVYTLHNCFLLLIKVFLSSLYSKNVFRIKCSYKSAQ